MEIVDPEDIERLKADQQQIRVSDQLMRPIQACIDSLIPKFIPRPLLMFLGHACIMAMTVMSFLRKPYPHVFQLPRDQHLGWMLSLAIQMVTKGLLARRASPYCIWIRNAMDVMSLQCVAVSSIYLFGANGFFEVFQLMIVVQQTMTVLCRPYIAVGSTEAILAAIAMHQLGAYHDVIWRKYPQMVYKNDEYSFKEVCIYGLAACMCLPQLAAALSLLVKFLRQPMTLVNALPTVFMVLPHLKFMETDWIQNSPVALLLGMAAAHAACSLLALTQDHRLPLPFVILYAAMFGFLYIGDCRQGHNGIIAIGSAQTAIALYYVFLANLNTEIKEYLEYDKTQKKD